MPLTDKPYLPLYVRDWLTSNKLNMCSAKAHGVLINVMCVMHRENDYGKILLKQKFKQTGKQISDFASQLAKMFALEVAEIESGLGELLDEKVLVFDGDFLVCERMVKDAQLSETRANSGSKGGKKTIKIFAQAKVQANAENDIESKIGNEDVIDLKGVQGETDKYESLKSSLLDANQYREARSMTISRNLGGIEKVRAESIHDGYVVDFILSLKGSKKWEGEGRATEHFMNWVNKKIEIEKEKLKANQINTNSHIPRIDRAA